MTSEQENKKIDFFCIGAQKAGTSWLYNRLRELPDFSLPPIKEIHYFDRSSSYPSPNHLKTASLSNRLTNFKWLSKSLGKISLTLVKGQFKDARWLIKWFFSNYSDDWYYSLFDYFDGLSGDITPGYSILTEDDVQRIYELTPDSKIIFILRNPIDRAWSHYKFRMQMLGISKSELLKERNIIKFMESDRQEMRSDYLGIIDRYHKFFPEDQILICFYDEIKNDPLSFLTRIVSFIGGDGSNIIKSCDLQSQDNASSPLAMPENIKTYLKAKYTSMIQELADKYGNSCSHWLQS